MANGKKGEINKLVAIIALSALLIILVLLSGKIWEAMKAIWEGIANLFG